MLDMPTPEVLEAQAADLEKRADRKDRQADADWTTNASADALRTDARYFREEAKAKRAKAERLRKATEIEANPDPSADDVCETCGTPRYAHGAECA